MFRLISWLISSSKRNMDLNEIKRKLANDEIVGLTIFGEARNEPIEGKIAVGNVIRNRLWSRDDYGGRNYKEICLADKQFSCWFEYGGKENYDSLMRATSLVMRGQSYNNAVLRECLFLGEGICNNFIRDNVNGATYFRTVNLMKESPVKLAWSIEISNHVFYKV
jgi:cell wall hydrolase